MSKQVAVTGADGFIGSHLVEALVESGNTVSAMVQYNSFNSWGWLDTLTPEVMDHVHVHAGDVRDLRSVLDLVHDAPRVVHLAALISVPYSFETPRSFIDTNVGGTLNVLEACRMTGSEMLVHVSSSEVYGTARTTPIQEGHPLQAQSPYAASKIAAEKLAESFALSYGLPVVVLRPFNTFGPRQSARAVIPTIISQVAAGHPVIHLGALEPTRDFNYVRDIVNAFVDVGTSDDPALAGNVFNVGSGSEIAIGRLVTLIAQLMGRQVDVRVEDERLRPDDAEVMRLVCDGRRLREATGWEPCHTLERGLELTAAWFQHPTNLARYKTGVYNV